MSDPIPHTESDRVLAGVKARPSGWPSASRPRLRARPPGDERDTGQHRRTTNPGLYGFRGLPKDRFLDRSDALDRIAADRAIVASTVAAMSDEQDSALIATGPETGAITALGTHILKVMTTRYGRHPDFDSSWVPEGGMPGLL